MAQLLVRKFDDDLKRRLRERDSKHGVSMEEEARTILSRELLRPDQPELGLGTRIAALFRDIPGNDEPLPEFPREVLRPYDLDKE